MEGMEIKIHVISNGFIVSMPVKNPIANVSSLRGNPMMQQQQTAFRPVAQYCATLNNALEFIKENSATE